MIPKPLHIMLGLEIKCSHSQLHSVFKIKDNYNPSMQGFHILTHIRIKEVGVSEEINIPDVGVSEEINIPEVGVSEEINIPEVLNMIQNCDQFE
jgi:hypothetical protein